MEDTVGAQLPTQTVSGRLDNCRSSLENYGHSDSSNYSSEIEFVLFDSCKKTILTSPSKSRRTLRQSRTSSVENDYPLPDSSKHVIDSTAAPLRSNTNDAFTPHPPQSIKLLTMQERERPQGEDDTVICNFSKNSSTLAMEPPSDIVTADNQPSPSVCKDFPEKSTIREKSIAISSEVKSVRRLKEKGEMKKDDVQSVDYMTKVACKIAVVYNGEKEFTTGPVDIALSRYAKAEGDAILVVAFLEYILSPMGMKMVADLQLFSGVNEAVLNQTIVLKKKDLETKLDNCLQVCRTKKILLEIKVLPGCNSKALVAKEIIDFQATSVIFDKNAMKNRKYYENNLSCHILQLHSYSRGNETSSFFLLGFQRRESLTSQRSDSDSSSRNPVLSTTSSIWSKLNFFSSKSSDGSRRLKEGCIPRNVKATSDRSSLGIATKTLQEIVSYSTSKPNTGTSSKLNASS